jgi:hypothetical protein
MAANEHLEVIEITSSSDRFWPKLPSIKPIGIASIIFDDFEKAKHRLGFLWFPLKSATVNRLPMGCWLY